jgi:hypothetical protein
VTLAPRDEALLPTRVLRGHVSLRGTRVSIAERAWRAAHAVVIRESGP